MDTVRRSQSQPAIMVHQILPAVAGSKPVLTQLMHPAQVLNLRRRGGELICHNIVQCLLCHDAAGCPMVDTVVSLNEGSPVKSVASWCILLMNFIEVELPKIVNWEISLPFDEEECGEEHIEMNAVMKALFSSESKETYYSL
jgi:hypothetical protein